MKVVIAGSRTITDYAEVVKAVEASGFQIEEVVSGTARGVDRLGEQWAYENNVKCSSMPADWSRYGRGAGYIRNTEMAEYADAAILLWDGESRGTRQMMNQMIKLNKPYYLMEVKSGL